MGDHSFVKGLANLFTVHKTGIILVLTPIILSPIMLTNNIPPNRCMYLLLIMAVYWICEVVPLGVTALLPVVFFPIMDITPTERSCVLFFKEALYMFITSILVAASIEYSRLHERLALRVIHIIGCSPIRLHFGICSVSMLLSMWITNSGVTAMMCPIVYAILDQLSAQGLVKNYHEDDEDLPQSERRPSELGACFYLSVGYAALIGGTGTLIGTPANLSFKGIYESRFPNATENLEFGLFMFYSMPMSIVFTFLMFISMEVYYMGLFRPNSKSAKKINIGKEGAELGRKIVAEKYSNLGPLSTHELSVTIVFVSLIVLYVLREPGFVQGWVHLFDCRGIKDSVITVGVLLLLFILPDNYQFLKFNSEESFRKTKSLLEWYFAKAKIPWGMVFVIGGGATLSDGSISSGMANKLGHALTSLDVLPPSLILLISIAFTVVLTNFGTNTAIINITIPVVAEMAVGMKLHPLFLIFPVGLSCSMAFMTPVGTASNAIIQTYGPFPMIEMIGAGFLPSVTTILALWILAQTWGMVIYTNLYEFPAWAAESE